MVDRMFFPWNRMIGAEHHLARAHCATRWRSASGVNTSASKKIWSRYSVGFFFSTMSGLQFDGETKQA